MENDKRDNVNLLSPMQLRQRGRKQEHCGKAFYSRNYPAGSDSDELNYQNNPYFDVSDLIYVGTYEQEFANGAGFENPEDNDPIFVWKKYVSSDGETFCFDDQGRLRKYMNAFYSNPGGDFEENKTNGTQASAKMKSAAELEKISEDIAENYMVTEEAVRVEPYDGNGSYIIKNAET